MNIKWTRPDLSSPSDWAGAAMIAVLLVATFAALAASEPAGAASLAREYKLKKCPELVLGSSGYKRTIRYARYKGITCQRAREVIRILQSVDGSYPEGYSRATPHGAPPYRRVFDGRLHSAYYAPDGYSPTGDSDDMVAVVLYTHRKPLSAWRRCQSFVLLEPGLTVFAVTRTSVRCQKARRVINDFHAQTIGSSGATVADGYACTFTSVTDVSCAEGVDGSGAGRIAWDTEPGTP